MSANFQGDESYTPVNLATVRDMWLAHSEGRIDDMLQTMHADVEWEPWSRPGLSVYSGHDGIRRMLADILVAVGAHTIYLDEVIEVEPDLLTVRSRIVRRDDPMRETALEMRVEMREGLIFRVVTLAV